MDGASEEPRHTPLGRSLARRYCIEFGAAMVAYSLVMLTAGWLSRRHPEWGLGLAVAPLVPIWFALGAVLRFLRRLDEFQRRLHFEALGFAFAAGVLATMTWGMFEALAGFPRLSWTWIPAIFVALWGVGLALAQRRYR